MKTRDKIFKFGEAMLEWAGLVGVIIACAAISIAVIASGVFANTWLYVTAYRILFGTD